MSVDRRDFLKIAGISAFLGVGGKAAFELLAPGAVEAKLESIPLTQAKRWAMVIDMPNMDETIMDRCVEACHHVHNVPNMGDKKHAIFWIWKEEYEHAFPGQEHEYIGEKYHHKPFLLLCNHCTNPPCVRFAPPRPLFSGKTAW